MDLATSNDQFQVLKNVHTFHTPFSEEEFLDYRRKTTEFVARILQQTSEQDPMFKFTDIVLSGSVAEGLKVREMNELDFLLVLDAKFQILEDCEELPGFVSIVSEEKLHPFSLRRQFYRALVSSLEILGLVGSVIVKTRIHGASVKLQFHGAAANLPITVTIDVDLVLALKGPAKFWPKCSRHWLEKPHGEGIQAEVIQKAIDTGVYLVPKYVYETKDESDKQGQPVQWRLSFSAIESIILQTLSDVQRNAFRVMKVILEEQRNTDICGKSSEEIGKNHITLLITTYHIKTILLHENENVLLSTLGVREYLICLLKKLIDSLKNMTLTHYFVPDINLFAGLSEWPSDRFWKESRLELEYKFAIQQFESLVESLPLDLSELINESIPGQVVIGIPPLPSS